MKKSLEVGVIGLGKFGRNMALTLVQLGHKVLGVDLSESRIQAVEGSLDHVYRADARDPAVLRELRFQDLDCVVVSVGESMDVSLLVILNLLDLNISKIWVKASSEAHCEILKRMGIDGVFLPERDAAVVSAHRLANPSILDLIPQYGGILLQECEVDAWDGKTLIDLDLMNKSNVLVLAVRKADSTEWVFVPRARTLLSRGDTVMVVGRQEDVAPLQY